MDAQDDVEFLSFLLTKTKLQKVWNWAHGGAVSDNGTLFVCHSQLGLWMYKTTLSFFLFC